MLPSLKLSPTKTATNKETAFFLPLKLSSTSTELKQEHGRLLLPKGYYSGVSIPPQRCDAENRRSLGVSASREWLQGSSMILALSSLFQRHFPWQMQMEM
jgi:hypothetical protein